MALPALQACCATVALLPQQTACPCARPRLLYWPHFSASIPTNPGTPRSAGRPHQQGPGPGLLMAASTRLAPGRGHGQDAQNVHVNNAPHANGCPRSAAARRTMHAPPLHPHASRYAFSSSCYLRYFPLCLLAALPAPSPGLAAEQPRRRPLSLRDCPSRRRTTTRSRPHVICLAGGAQLRKFVHTRLPCTCK